MPARRSPKLVDVVPPLDPSWRVPCEDVLPCDDGASVVAVGLSGYRRLRLLDGAVAWTSREAGTDRPAVSAVCGAWLVAPADDSGEVLGVFDLVSGVMRTRLDVRLLGGPVHAPASGVFVDSARFDLETGAKAFALAPPGWVGCVARAPSGGEWFAFGATAEEGGRPALFTFDPATGAALRAWELDEDIDADRLFVGRSGLVAAMGTRRLLFLDPEAREVSYEHELTDDEGDWGRAVACPDGRRLAVVVPEGSGALAGALCAYDLADGEQLATVEGAITCAAFDGRGERLALGTYGSEVVIVDPATWKEVGTVDLRALSKGACAASDDAYVSAISWVGGVLVVGTSDGEVALVRA